MAQPPVDPLSPASLKAHMDEGERPVLVDVRDRSAFEDWHIQGAHHIPLEDLEDGNGEVPADPSDRIVLVSDHGVRAQAAARRLAEDGFDEARPLEGGMRAWNRVYERAEIAFGGPTKVLQFQRRGQGCLTYLVINGSDAVVIDPTIDTDQLVDAAAREGANISKVLSTHHHADHASGAPALQRRVQAEHLAPEGPLSETADRTLVDGDTVPVGDAFLEVLATPGHTGDSVTYKVGDCLFTGDTLLVEGLGCPDLGVQDRAAQEAAGQLWSSIQRLLDQNDDVRVLPGHATLPERTDWGRPVQTRVGDLRARIQRTAPDEERFVSMATRRCRAATPSMKALRRYNAGQDRDRAEEELRALEVGPDRSRGLPAA